MILCLVHADVKEIYMHVYISYTYMTLQAEQQTNTVLFRGGEWKPTYTSMLVLYFSLVVDVGFCGQEVNGALAKGELFARDMTSTQEEQDLSNYLSGLEFE